MSEKFFEKDKVTAVIPVYNEERYLRQCLESVVDQVDCVILGDNASTDGTEAICREFAEKYPHIKLFRHNENTGCYNNSVFCARKVETEFFFHLGGHDIISPHFVRELKKTLREHPTASCAFPSVCCLSVDGQETYINHCPETLEQMADDNPFVRSRVFSKMTWQLPCFMLCRSESCLSYLTNFKLYTGADIDWVHKCLLKGPGIYVKDAVFYWRLKNNTDEGYYSNFIKRLGGDDRSKKLHLEHHTMCSEMLADFQATHWEDSTEDQKQSIYLEVIQNLKDQGYYIEKKDHCEHPRITLILSSEGTIPASLNFDPGIFFRGLLTMLSNQTVDDFQVLLVGGQWDDVEREFIDERTSHDKRFILIESQDGKNMPYKEVIKAYTTNEPVMYLRRDVIFHPVFRVPRGFCEHMLKAPFKRAIYTNSLLFSLYLAFRQVNHIVRTVVIKPLEKAIKLLFFRGRKRSVR